jgi:hypothetical protein
LKEVKCSESLGLNFSLDRLKTMKYIKTSPALMNFKTKIFPNDIASKNYIITLAASSK